VRRALILTAAIFFGSAGTASAHVLISGIPKHLVCGDAISPGVYAQPGTVHRAVTVKAIDRRTGKVWWHRSLTVPHHWRYWVLPSGRRGRCGATTIAYRGVGLKARYTVRFRSEGV
jgi:hypothetical protein